MLKIDNRTLFLTTYNGFLGEYSTLLLQMLITAIMVMIFFPYVPIGYSLGAMVLILILFLGRWKSINEFLLLEDEPESLEIASKKFKNYLLWLGGGSVFIALASILFINRVPDNYQFMILLLLLVLISTSVISTMSFETIYLIFVAPLALAVAYITLKNGSVEYQILTLIAVLVIAFSIASLKVKRGFLRGLAQKKLDAERFQSQINKEAQNLRQYIDATDELDIGTILVDNKNRIIYNSMSIEKWFPMDKSMSYDRFFASIIRDINELNKQEIISKSGRKYRVVSKIIEDIDANMYYLKLFKDTTKEYKYNKNSFRESVINPEPDKSDRLTKLLKKEPFMEYLDQAIYEADITSTKIALLIIDINDFNYIGETYGEKIADDVLVILAKRLKNSTRDSDIVGRYGDDELIVALKLIEDIETIEVVAKKILKNLIRPFRIIDEKDIFITVNIGISIYPDNTKDIYKLEKQALTALKEAKNQKRNGYLMFRDVP